MVSERIHDLLDLLADEPDDTLLRFTLGKEYLEAEVPAEALPHLEKVVALDPQYTVAYRYLGTALDQLGRDGEAADVWERGIAVAETTGDLQAGKEMQVLLGRLRSRQG